MGCCIRKYGSKQKTYQVHRFVWECFNSAIPEGKVIDHINNDNEDNRLCNLQLMTQQQKSAKDRDVRSRLRIGIIHLLLKIMKIESV